MLFASNHHHELINPSAANELFPPHNITIERFLYLLNILQR